MMTLSEPLASMLPTPLTSMVQEELQIPFFTVPPLIEVDMVEEPVTRISYFALSLFCRDTAPAVEMLAAEIAAAVKHLMIVFLYIFVFFFCLFAGSGCDRVRAEFIFAFNAGLGAQFHDDPDDVDQRDQEQDHQDGWLAHVVDAFRVEGQGRVNEQNAGAQGDEFSIG